ncbi:MAG: AbgT family transporter [Opitutales bacterium]
MQGSADSGKTKNLLGRFLATIEWVGNRLPDPVVLYAGLALLVPFLSAIAVWSGWSRVHPVTGETIGAINLLETSQIQRMLTEAVTNFTSFAPLGAVLVTVMGIGVAERTGLIDAAIRLTVLKAPKALISGVVVFAGVMSSMAADSGYVVLTPLGAVIFAGLGRHPLAGLAAAFAGVAGGFSANLLVTSLDPLLSGFTQAGAQLYDADYEVTPDSNYFFMIASTFLITVIGWWVTEKIVEPRLGTYKAETAPDEAAKPEATETEVPAKAIQAALVSLVGFAIVLLWSTLPSDGLLRDEEGTLTPFIKSLVPVIALGFLIPGLAFGIASGSLRSSKDLAGMLADSMATMGGYIVLSFAAAQFVSYFGWSNLGILTALEGAHWLQSIQMGPLPILLCFILLAACVNLAIGSASGKWGIMAPVFVPMFMILGLSPETTQAAYRVGDSVTNMITPLNPYFPIILSFAMKYDRKIGVGTLIATMIPYSIAFAIGWVVLFSLWYFFAWPLGPGAELLLNP